MSPVKMMCLRHTWVKFGFDRNKKPRFQCKKCGVTTVGEKLKRGERKQGISDKAFLEILEYLAQGYSYREIAKLGFCSKSTVEHAVSNLREEIEFYKDVHVTDDKQKIARGLILDIRLVERFC